MPRKSNRTTDESDLAVMANDIKYIREDILDIKRKLENEYITRQEFDPVKKIVYGIIGVVLTGVLGSLLGLIILK